MSVTRTGYSPAESGSPRYSSRRESQPPTSGRQRPGSSGSNSANIFDHTSSLLPKPYSSSTVSESAAPARSGARASGYQPSPTGNEESKASQRRRLGGSGRPSGSRRAARVSAGSG